MSLPQITLTEVEQELKTLLLDVAKHVNPEKPSELRFTGGWVRDKLLGVGSYDIDVAINDMTGYQFGLRMKDYLDIPGKAEMYGIKERASGDEETAADDRHVVRDLHKIEANPEKSKHLETVTTRIFGLDIDIVNLRKETYSDDSRNPQMEFGTPEEDALRRDATINAMFYNLQTSQIEDFTGRGRDDMQAHILRTPLDPYQTFKDDPLRVLRLIRFSSRLLYALDPALEKSAQDESIKQALALKISRERVGVEIDKMLQGPHPLVAVKLIDRLGLYKTIFIDPERDHGYQPEVDKWRAAYTMSAAIADASSGSLALLSEGETEHAYHLYLLSAAVPWFDAPTRTPAKPGGKIPPPVAVEVFRNGIKASNKVSDLVLHCLNNADEIIKTKDDYYHHAHISHLKPDNGGPAGRDTLGMLIRKWGPTWKAQVAFAMMLESTRAERSRPDIIKEYAALLARIEEAGIQQAHALKPVIDGTALAKALESRPGPWMKAALDEVMAWQLGHPDDASAEAAVAALRSKTGELPTRLVSHLLSLTVRPLFSQTRTQSELGVTPQGRRAISGAPLARSRAGLESFADADAKRPWKLARHADALQLLAWCVDALHADPARARTRDNWALLVPTLLTLVDDVDVRFKALGCRLLGRLCDATDPAMLARTGLADVFHDAVAPCLSYLPTLTAEGDAVEMLGAAYPALLALAAARHPSTSPDAAYNAPREQYLADILHKHLLAAFAHITPDTYPALAACLLAQLAAFAHALGSGTVAHLQYMVPAVTEALATPFGAAAPVLLVAGVRALDAIMQCARPRVWRWRADVLAGLCSAWLSIEDEAARATDARYVEARVQLRATLARLRSIMAAGVRTDARVDAEDEREADRPDFEAELRQIVEAEERLQGLVE